MKFFNTVLFLIIAVMLLVSCSPNEGDTIEKYYEDDDDSAGEDDDSGVDDDDVADDDDNDTADDDDSTPTQIPEVPTELRAIESGSNAINLSWTDNSDDEDGFWVYRQEAGTKGFTAIAQTGPDVPFYFDDSAACETQYDYYVTAFNMAGESAGSNEAAATAGYCDVAPPTDLAAVTISQTQVDLSWLDNSFNETNFQIQRKESGSDVWVNIGDAEANVTDYSDLVAVCDTDYQYRVRAYNQHSDSAWCSPAGTSTMDCPIIRPQPVLGSIEPGSYVALSRDYLQPPPDPLYPLEIIGEGIAADTKVMMNNFVVPCDTGGEGINCEADDNGDPVTGTCATTCTASLPDDVMRHADEYVVKLFTPSPVFGGDGTSADHEFFNVVAPQPVIDRIWPRGVLQLLDSNGTPIPQTINVRIWGRDVLDNAQVRLHSNYGEVLSIDTDTDTGDQEIEVLVSTAGISPRDAAYEFGMINPSPGGGECIRPFGVNALIENWDEVVSTDLRGTRPAGPEPMVQQLLTGPSQMSTITGLHLSGGAQWVALRDSSGRLLRRTATSDLCGVIPYKPGDTIDLQVISGIGSIASLSGSNLQYRGGDGTFGDKTDYDMGEEPKSIAIEDLNGDGTPDFVTGNINNVAIRLGNGDGTFGTKTQYNMGAEPVSVVLGDLNGDSTADIATANKYSSNVSIRLGNGDGTFGDKTDYGMGARPFSIVLGDLNGDGAPDIATGNEVSDTISIRLGNGNGTFGAETNYDMGQAPVSIALGDLNGDGAPDIATANNDSDNVSVRLGTGNGTYQAKTDYDMGQAPVSIAFGDLNGDGALDIATANNNSDNVSIRLGNGDGTYQAKTEYNMGEAPVSIAFGDLNGDGSPDIVAANGVTYASIRLGNGDGTFGAKIDYFMAYEPFSELYSVAIIDLNSDGALDIATTTNGDASLSIRLGNGNETFDAKTEYNMGDGVGFIAIGDLNSDGEGDIATANTWSDNVSIRLGNGDGKFGTKTDYDMGDSTGSVAIGDLNGDNAADIATTNWGSSDVSIRLGNGDGTFGAKNDYGMGDGPVSIALGDLNGDRALDIATANNDSDNVSIRLGNGDGTFGSKTDYNMGDGPKSIAIDDLNGDGDPDIATANFAIENVSIRLGNGDGTLGAQNTYDMGDGSTSIAIGDLNGDALADIATANMISDNVSICLGNGDGTFDVKNVYGMGDGPNSIVLGDLNGDGAPDIATANIDSDNVSIRLGNGDGTFGANTDYNMGDGPNSIALGDLNGDSVTDIASANFWSNDVSIRMLGVIPGTWHQELTDSFSDDPNQPWLAKYATGGANTMLQIHQGKQIVSKVGATLLLEWTTEPSGTVSLVLTAPDGQEVDLGSYSTFTPWPDEISPTSWRLNKVFREYDLGTAPGFPDLENLHGLQPTGYWELEVNNQTGADAEVKNWTVITDGTF